MFILKKTLSAMQERMGHAVKLAKADRNSFKAQRDRVMERNIELAATVRGLNSALAASQAALVRANVDQDSRVAAEVAQFRADVKALTFMGSYGAPAKVSRMPYITAEMWAQMAQEVQAAAREPTYKGRRKAGWMAGAGSVKP